MIGINTGVRTARYSGAGTNIVFDGNSLVAGVGASSAASNLPAQLAALAPLNGAVSVVNIGVSGQNITDMRNRGASFADANYVAGKTNVLIVWEGTNTVCNNVANSGKTGAAAGADLAAYCADRRAAHPDWTIVLLTTMPRFNIPSTAYTIATANDELSNYNTYIKNNFRGMGARRVIDVRASGVFTYTGTTCTALMQTYMSEATGAVHCNDSGYALIAGYCATGLRALPMR